MNDRSLKLDEGSIGVIFIGEGYNQKIKHYIIEKGKAKYIAEIYWHLKRKSGNIVNAPLYETEE